MKCMHTVHEMDTALDTALEMDTVGHELILAWVERGQPTFDRGGVREGGVREVDVREVGLRL